MPGVFVTAAGTEIGKTYVTAGLLRAGRRAGLAMDALKPVMSGFSPDALAESDAGLLLDALGATPTEANVAHLSPWRFAAPLAPDMAAAAEGRALDFGEIVEACRATARSGRFALIEGVGGVMVPLAMRYTVLDLIAALGLPVLLVSSTGLGAISHCLTACEALRGRGVAPPLIVLNQIAETPVPLEGTRAAISRFNPGSAVHVVPRDAAEKVFDQLLSDLVRLPA